MTLSHFSSIYNCVEIEVMDSQELKAPLNDDSGSGQSFVGCAQVFFDNTAIT